MAKNRDCPDKIGTVGRPDKRTEIIKKRRNLLKDRQKVIRPVLLWSQCNGNYYFPPMDTYMYHISLQTEFMAFLLITKNVDIKGNIPTWVCCKL